MKKYVLGIDQSTQGTKAVLFDTSGYLISRFDLPHHQIVSKEGWVSHNLSEIYKNVIQAAKRVIQKSGINKEEIACLGITNQRETTAAWNRTIGEPLADAIVWQCNRAKDICTAIGEESQKAQEVYIKTGLKLSPYYPAAKMAWLIKNNEKIADAEREKELALGTIDSWLIYKLTKGKSFMTDYSNASRTQLFNISDLKWDEKICELFKVPVEALPTVVDSDSNFGTTNLEGYLDSEIPICGVLGDSHGALFGHNCRIKGDIKATYGTGSSVMLNTGEIMMNSSQGLSTSLAWKIKGTVSYALEGNINYTGAVISWLKELGIIEDVTQVSKMALQANPEDKTCIIPAFTGLGAPWWKNEVRASITGVSRSTGKNEMVRAACDCIAFQINDVIDAMRRDTKLHINELCVDGGPTRNQYLMQIQSDITEVDVRIPSTEELSVLGAAYLAGLTNGLYEEETLYDALSYQKFSSLMEEKKRAGKLLVWNQNIQKLL